MACVTHAGISGFGSHDGTTTRRIPGDHRVHSLAERLFALLIIQGKDISRNRVLVSAEEGKKAIADLQNFVARNGIFFPPELKTKFARVSEMLWSAVISKEVGHEAKDYKMQNEGWKKIKEESEPLCKSIESDIQARLQSHAKRP
ncbi:MAG: hypothetical protein ABIU05_01420 [Nitrospirales bacterium]